MQVKKRVGSNIRERTAGAERVCGMRLGLIWLGRVGCAGWCVGAWMRKGLMLVRSVGYYYFLCVCVCRWWWWWCVCVGWLVRWVCVVATLTARGDVTVPFTAS